MPELNTIVQFFSGLQESICKRLEALDGTGKFQEDNWERTGGGGGRSRVLSGGNHIEKGGVNFSHVSGILPSEISAKLELSENLNFNAAGVSIVIHHHNPFAPILHMNVRYFEMEDGTYWFGGGVDLTPIYIDLQQARWFHQKLRETCDAFDPEYYARFKQWCDTYFFLRHRKESRGAGGLFFDHLGRKKDKPKTHYFDFTSAVGEQFLPIYTYMLEANAGKPFRERHKHFQLIRRSRYVEFNLLYDKGTRFGLDTDGRTESILMSMPPEAKWVYNYVPEAGSEEALTLANLKAIDWLKVKG